MRVDSREGGDLDNPGGPGGDLTPWYDDWGIIRLPIIQTVEGNPASSTPALLRDEDPSTPTTTTTPDRSTCSAAVRAAIDARLASSTVPDTYSIPGLGSGAGTSATATLPTTAPPATTDTSDLSSRAMQAIR